MKSFFKDFQKWFFRFSSIYVIVVLLCIVRVDYYLYLPGNTTDIKNKITIVDKDNNLNGSVSAVYVLTYERPTLFQYLLTKDAVYAVTYKMTKEDIASSDPKLSSAIGRFDSDESFNNASLAAYSLLIEDEVDFYNEFTYIYSANSDIDCVILDSNIKNENSYLFIVGKKVTGYENNPNSNPKVSEVSDYLKTKNVGEIATLYIEDKIGNEYTINIKKRLQNNSEIFGITIKTTYTLKDGIKTEISNVYTEGPSGGAMEALYIYLVSSREDLLKGRKISGTGTISYSLDGDGNIESFSKVGPIGCVEQKIYAAYIDNMDIFYCPKENYDACIKAATKYGILDKIKIVKVEYLIDIINDLKG